MKVGKYAQLDQAYFFNPVAMETTGTLGPRTAAFLKELGRRIHQETGKARSSAFLLQHLSVAVQRGNAAAVMGTCGPHLRLYPSCLMLHFLFYCPTYKIIYFITM